MVVVVFGRRRQRLGLRLGGEDRAAMKERRD